MNKYDKKMIETAEIWSELSSCKKRKVGAVIARDNRPVSVGYNGTLPKSLSNNDILINNDCEDENGKTKDHVAHAEFNALMFMSRENISPVGCTLYVTTKPCPVCADLIVNMGIKKVVYKEDDKSKDGLEYLDLVGIETIGYK